MWSINLQEREREREPKFGQSWKRVKTKTKIESSSIASFWEGKLKWQVLNWNLMTVTNLCFVANI